MRADRVRYLIRHAIAHVAIIAVVVGFVYTLSIPMVVELLDLQSAGPAIALAPLVVVGFMLMLPTFGNNGQAKRLTNKRE